MVEKYLMKRVVYVYSSFSSHSNHSFPCPAERKGKALRIPTKRVSDAGQLAHAHTYMHVSKYISPLPSC